MIYLDFNGRGPGLVSPELATVSASDRGLLYGDGLFETMLVRDGAVPLLPWHLERLAASASAVGIPYNEDSTRRAVETVANTVGNGEHALRLTLTRGAAEQRGYLPPPEPAPTLLITAAPYARPTRPLTAATATVRINPDSFTSRFKSTSALDKVMARDEAARAGADEALLLNLMDRPAEGASSNLFIVKDGLWLTPELYEGCLPGVMRRRVLELTGATETGLSVSDLFAADAVYLTNALMGLVPLVALDGRPLPSLSTQPFTLNELFATLP